MYASPLKLHLDELHVESFSTSTLDPSGIESPNYDLGQQEPAGFHSSCIGGCVCGELPF
jgi:hypothetical protein